jgi:hypothetical protein
LSDSRASTTGVTRITTLYEIGVARQGVGLGGALIGALEREASRAGSLEIRVKCPIDLPANEFYSGLHMDGVQISGSLRDNYSTAAYATQLKTAIFSIGICANEEINLVTDDARLRLQQIEAMLHRDVVADRFSEVPRLHLFGVGTPWTYSWSPQAESSSPTRIRPD